MPGAVRKSLDRPEEHVEVSGVTVDAVSIGDATIARYVMQPGEHCGQMDPVAGRRRCVAHHTGLVTSGRLHIEMEDGPILEAGPNDVIDIPPGHDGWVISDEPMTSVEWSGFRTWMAPTESTARILVSLLLTDIVGSTDMAARLGDTAWRDLLARHNQQARLVLDRFRGREVNTTGDGFLAIFDGAGRAVGAARAMIAGARHLGLDIRAGVHTGEVEVAGSDVRGLAVHEAARIAAAAAPGEILVSATTRLLAGADVDFEPRGEHQLKGLAAPMTLFAAAPAD